MFLEIEKLSFKYKGSKEYVIEGFDFAIEKGEIVSFFGQSGCGKSTLLRLIAGLEIPNAGTMKIDQKIIINENIFIVPEKRGIGMVFQDYALFPHLTVKGNIKFGLKDMSKKEKEARLEEVMELVNLQGYDDRYPFELSGGQQQRVAIARALAPKPSLLLLDEPFSNLDRDLQYKIRSELKSIIQKAGITSIFVTHDREDCKAVADRVLVLEKGLIIREGNPKEILEQ